MKTSWNELHLIEDFLLSDTTAEDKILFEARAVLQPDLKESVFWQQRTYDLIERYGRQQLRKEIEQVHEKLFTAPGHFSFRKKIMNLFNK
ncbi:hypothetical protein TH53_00905 [Pedobacter lusitanus]|uniref:Uncharacterized protein n=1 Tax=Pedobacter lusitanus TaxID=1503925 RepID=A0A0D0GRS4_9SPHI|nr:hypothetical protein [Pedobacter lusitanus]KIO78900.1 hypothetical protein TH53_00905 [Pedobacter lusitanus]